MKTMSATVVSLAAAALFAATPAPPFGWTPLMSKPYVAPGDWRVWRLDTDGSRRGEVADVVRDGSGVCFTADTAGDPSNATILYEIVREGLTVETNPDTGGIVRMRVAGENVSTPRGKMPQLPRLGLSLVLDGG